MDVRLILRCLLVGFLSIASFSTMGQDHDYDATFVEAYFAENHRAIVFPEGRSKAISPGDVLRSTYFTPYADLDTCTLTGVDREDLVRQHKPAVQFRLTSDSWKAKIKVAAERGGRANVELNVSREDEIRELTSETSGDETYVVAEELWLPEVNIGKKISPSCLGYYDYLNFKDSILNGTLFVADKLFTFVGGFETTSSFELSADAGVSLSAADIVPKIEKIGWLQKLLNKLVKIEGNVLAESIGSSVTVMRFPFPGEGFRYSHLAFQPRYINPATANEFILFLNQSGEEIESALFDGKNARTFLLKNPRFSVRGEESAFRELFLPEQLYKHYEKSSAAAAAISKVIRLNQVAGYLTI